MLGAVRADDLLAVEVLWTPEEEVRVCVCVCVWQCRRLLLCRLLVRACCWRRRGAVDARGGAPSGCSAAVSAGARGLSSSASHPDIMPRTCRTLPQGDFFTVEDLAYDYPTLNTL